MAMLEDNNLMSQPWKTIHHCNCETMEGLSILNGLNQLTQTEFQCSVGNFATACDSKGKRCGNARGQ